ncbi:MAG: hypothetical protein KAX68_06705, partial [Giesbergeria sp.]|nr:hypothetical protein [Giesbergeria sp.]
TWGRVIFLWISLGLCGFFPQGCPCAHRAPKKTGQQPENPATKAPIALKKRAKNRFFAPQSPFF